MTYTKGLLYENEATEKSLEIRQLIPSRENMNLTGLSLDSFCNILILQF